MKIYKEVEKEIRVRPTVYCNGKRLAKTNVNYTELNFLELPKKGLLEWGDVLYFYRVSLFGNAEYVAVLYKLETELEELALRAQYINV